MFEQKQLIKRIEEKILLFDAELKVLRHEKARIAVFMKNADLRYLFYIIAIMNKINARIRSFSKILINFKA